MLCHRIGPLQQNGNHAPAYCQLYIYDGREALNHRLNRNTNLRQDTLLQLQHTLLQHHQYAPIFRHAFEVLREHGDVDISLSLHCLTENDRRRYNLPSTDEVAVIIPNKNAWDKDSRDILLRYRNGGLMHISEAHPAYACLHYVLLFPYGEHGYHWRIKMNDPTNPRRRITLTRYLAFRLFPRQHEFSTILHGGRLFQQYLVDLWAQADQERLNWNRSHQTQLRAALYSGLQDVLTRGDANLNDIGQKIILPSSYIGGARHMHQIYQDSMAIARHFHKVDLFITMTCNPYCELAKNQRYS